MSIIGNFGLFLKIAFQAQWLNIIYCVVPTPNYRNNMIYCEFQIISATFDTFKLMIFTQLIPFLLCEIPPILANSIASLATIFHSTFPVFISINLFFMSISFPFSIYFPLFIQGIFSILPIPFMGYLTIFIAMTDIIGSIYLSTFFWIGFPIYLMLLQNILFVIFVIFFISLFSIVLNKFSMRNQRNIATFFTLMNMPAAIFGVFAEIIKRFFYATLSAGFSIHKVPILNKLPARNIAYLSRISRYISSGQFTIIHKDDKVFRLSAYPRQQNYTTLA